jgi:integrase
MRPVADKERTTMNLTKRSVAAIPVPEKGTVAVWDDAVPGYGVRVTYSGRRVYVIRYRNRHGKDRLFTFARVADMHPEAARDMARRLFSRIREGDDPAEDRVEARNAPTLAQLRDRMFEEHLNKRKDGTRRSYEQLWRLHILPAIGEDRLVAEIDERDVDRLVRHCGDRLATSNRALAVLSKALNLAERWKIRPRSSNPVRGTERHTERKRERTLEPDELPRVWAALDDPSVMPSAAAFFRLLILTGLRDSEWRLALWSWIDWTNEALRLPDSKTGQRSVPLSPDVLDILRSLPRSSIYILPGRKGGPMSGQRKIWRRVCAKAGIADAVRIHDIRHTVGSLAHRAGATQREVADLLGHRQLGTAARYIHGPGSEKHGNAARASAAILKIAKTPANQG